MRVLCCLDGTNAEQIAKATEILSADPPLTLSILHVIDIGPRAEMGHLRERFFRSRAQRLPHEEEILESEKSSARDILNAGLSYLTEAEPIEREGRPGHEIVNRCSRVASRPGARLRSRPIRGKASIGPKSVGHVARFVLDHAPCPVLLVRQLARE